MMKKYKKILKEFRSIKGRGKIILYGSVARGKSRFDSDIDLAVISDSKNFVNRAEKIADKILFKYNKVVSIQRFSEKEFKENSEPIIKEIKKGVIIHEGR